MASAAGEIVVSVNYGLAPKHGLPVAYYDSLISLSLRIEATNKDNDRSDPIDPTLFVS